MNPFAEQKSASIIQEVAIGQVSVFVISSKTDIDTKAYSYTPVGVMIPPMVTKDTVLLRFAKKPKPQK